LPIAPDIQLGNTVHIRLETQDIAAMPMSKMAITPMTVAADGALVLGRVALAGAYLTVCTVKDCRMRLF